MTERALDRFPAPVMRALEFAGLDIPLLALRDEPQLAVLGNRRAAALKDMRNFAEVPMFVARSVHDLALWCEADTASGQRLGAGQPWTWAQRGALLDHVLRELGTTSGGGSVVKTLADYFGVHEIQLRNAMYLLRWANQGGEEGERAASLLVMVESGEYKPQSAYRKLRGGDPVRGTFATSAPLMTARQQEKVLRNAAGALSGVVMGLRAMGDIAPDLPGSARADLVPPLQDARRLLARITRQLQGVEAAADESNDNTQGEP